MIRFYLGEEPILENVKTYLLSDPEVLEHVLERLAELVVKPTGESGGRGVMIGPHAEEEEIERMRQVLRAHPERWIAQDVVRLSTVPTVGADGVLCSRATSTCAPSPCSASASTSSRRAHASGAGGGLADRQLLARRGLEGHVGAGGRRRRRPRAARRSPTRSRRRCRTCATAPGPASSNSSSRRSSSSTRRGRRGLMLARIAHELYWLGRNLARAEFTARAVEAVFQAELQGTSDDPRRQLRLRRPAGDVRRRQRSASQLDAGRSAS